MDIKQLECFIDLAETLNFSITAQRMFLTQPTISNKIKQLENELGFQLFKRNKRNVELTGAGASFYEDMKEVVISINQGIAKARKYAEKYDSKYVIAYENNDLAIRYLAGIIEKFMCEYPNTKIELKMIDFKQKNTLFFEKKVDFLFTIQNNTIDILNAKYQELYVGHFICVVPNKNKLSNKDKITFDDLNGQTMVLLNPTLCPEEMKQMEKKIITACPLSPIIFSDNQLSGCTLAKCGLGIAIMPDFIYSADESLNIVPLETDDVVSYGAAWHMDDNSNKTKRLISIAKESYNKS
ncbi:MAG: LysR family transcriptional regulator [Anaerovoracaceae bacterium]